MKFLLVILALSQFLIVMQATAQDVKLMTYNIRLDVASDGENAWPRRREFLVAQIRFHDPGIFGIQEGLPQQVKYIDEQLEEYVFVGVGREGEDKGEYSAIYYQPAKYTLRENHTFWLSETPGQVSKGWDAALPRICTYALFTDNRTKSNFWVFNTHLDHQGDLARKNGVALILENIRKLNTDHLPVVLMGDFNATPETDVVVSVNKEMTDTREASEMKPFGPGGTFNSFEFSKPVIRRIDYIFVSKRIGIRVKKFAVLSDSDNLRYPSDHLPVFAEINLGK